MANKIWLSTANGNLSTAANWSGGTVPVSGDNVRFPAGSPDVTAGLTALNNSTLSGALAAVIFEDGNTMNVGSSAAPMQFSCTRLQGFFNGGQQFFDLEASNITPHLKAGSASTGQFGIYIKGSNLLGLDILGGYVAVAGLSFETATVATIRVVGSDANVFINEGVTLTTLEATGSAVDLRCAATTVTVYSPCTLTTWGTGTITTLNVYGGTANPNSTGTITTLNAQAGTTDFLQSAAARTVTNYNPSGSAVVKVDPAYITITTPSNPSIRYVASYALSS